MDSKTLTYCKMGEWENLLFVTTVAIFGLLLGMKLDYGLGEIGDNPLPHLSFPLAAQQLLFGVRK